MQYMNPYAMHPSVPEIYFLIDIIWNLKDYVLKKIHTMKKTGTFLFYLMPFGK